MSCVIPCSPQWCSCPDGEPNGDPACFPQNPDEIIFVPMVFGSDRNHHDTDPEVADYMDTVLGFNEPDKKNDISPVEAALRWSNLTQIYSDKVRKLEETRRKCRIIRTSSNVIAYD